MKYFTNIKTLDDLKKEYRRLVMLNHPDRGGDLETMKIINLEYEQKHEELKHAWNSTHGEDQQCTEAPGRVSRDSGKAAEARRDGNRTVWLLALDWRQYQRA